MVKERRGSRYDILTVTEPGERTFRIPVPKLQPATAEEAARRRQIFAEVDSITERMEPVSVDELLADDEEEEKQVVSGSNG